MSEVKLRDLLGLITKINTENFIEMAKICGAIAAQDPYIRSNVQTGKMYKSEDIGAQESFSSESDLSLSGELTTDLKAEAKNLKLSNVSALEDNKTLKLSGKDTLEVTDLVKGGDHPTEVSGNAQIIVNDSRIVKFSNLTFDENTASHNGVEIGLDSKSPAPQYVSFENCKFLGKFDNMAINIFAMQNNGVIDIKNCTFKNGTGIRFSNRDNAKNLTLNIFDCVMEAGSSHEPYPNEGEEFFLRLRDYTSKSVEASLESNFFGPEKLKVNFKNLVLPNGKLLTSDKDEIYPGGKRDILNITLNEKVAENRILDYDSKIYPFVTIQ